MHDKKIHLVLLFNEKLDLDDAVNYYIKQNHSYKETIIYLTNKYTEFNKSTISTVFLLPQMKKSKELINSHRINSMKCSKQCLYNSLNYDFIYDLYINKRLSIKQILELMGYPYTISIILKFIKENNIIRSKKGNPNYIPSLETIQKRKDTCLLKYGVSNPMQDPDVRKKADDTSIQRYGVNYKQKNAMKALQKYKQRTGLDNPFLDVEHIRQSVYNKYGVYSVNYVSEIKQKMSDTWHEHFDDVESFKLLDDRRKKTTFDRYGNCNYRNYELCRETCLQRYGVESYMLLDDWRLNRSRKDTKPNRDFANLLCANGIEYTTEFCVGGKLFDFKIGKYLVEVDPTITHNSTFSIYGEEAVIKPCYHHLKSSIAIDNGYICIHIFDWLDKQDIINKIKKNSIVGVQKERIQPVYYNMKSMCLSDLFDRDTVVVYTDGYLFIYNE